MHLGSLQARLAPNNGYVSNYPSYKGVFCTGDALKEKGISIAFDVAGAIPGLGNVTSAGVAITGTAYGIATVGNDPIAANSAAVGGAVPIFDMLLGGTKALPVVGNVVSGLTGLYDIYGAYKTYQSCMSSSKYD